MTRAWSDRMNFDRRTLMTGALSAALLPQLALAAMPPALRFNIFRNGKPFGSYGVGIVTSGDTTTVTSDVAMAMKISGLTVFNYKLHCVEVWKGGRFMALESQSTRDSDRQTVSASRGELGINVNNKGGAQLLPATANPLTHWNPAVLLGGAPLFNPEDGRLQTLKAQSMGRTPVILANGSKLLANQWAIRGQATIDDWYDDAGVWAGLKGVLPDRSIIEYRRV
jgi:hypothetical protein